MRQLLLVFATFLVLSVTASARAQTDSESDLARFTGFVAIGPSLVSVAHADGSAAGAPVGSQFGVVSLSLELQVLFFERFGLALTPLTWQPNGGVQDNGDHWRFVRVGGGLRVQALDPSRRARLGFGYDLSYLRATDVEHCFDCSSIDERARTFTGMGHSFSARVDVPIANTLLRVGARVEGGFSPDLAMNWVSVGVSLGFGQRATAHSPSQAPLSLRDPGDASGSALTS